jgi:hypothetical protein
MCILLLLCQLLLRLCLHPLRQQQQQLCQRCQHLPLVAQQQQQQQVQMRLMQRRRIPTSSQLAGSAQRLPWVLAPMTQIMPLAQQGLGRERGSGAAAYAVMAWSVPHRDRSQQQLRLLVLSQQPQQQRRRRLAVVHMLTGKGRCCSRHRRLRC